MLNHERGLFLSRFSVDLIWPITASRTGQVKVIALGFIFHPNWTGLKCMSSKVPSCFVSIGFFSLAIVLTLKCRFNYFQRQ